MYSNDTRQDFITLLVRVVHVAYIFLNLPMHISPMIFSGYSYCSSWIKEENPTICLGYPFRNKTEFKINMLYLKNMRCTCMLTSLYYL
jgi:hypothetical protein